jgi:5-bromo-4-chloroindolyl phosphate hydrolysis protein
MKGRKAIVFWTTLGVLVALYVGTMIFAQAMLASVGVTIILALVGNGATYVGGQVADAWQKSKYYKPELDRER